jgi:hypothetical protein
MNDNALDFAYRYPFSDEAKRIVEKQEDRINIKYLDMAAKHIDNALAGNLTYKEIKMDSIRLDYVMAYLYSRLLLSAVKRRDIIKSYALAEARRSAEILPLSDDSDVKRIAAELGIEMNSSFDSVRSNRQNEFAMSFVDYVNNTPKDKGFALVNQKLSNGVVLLNKTQLSRIIERAIEGEISKGLPIKSSDLPKQVIEYSKTLRFKTIAKAEQSSKKGSEAWIEKLLQTPIADVRHRTVNLILAPYLVNTKGIDVEQAAKIIIEYIDRCRAIDPNTKINERYIEYQCDYAKKKGLRPLSLSRAKELLGEQINFEDK